MTNIRRWHSNVKTWRGTSPVIEHWDFTQRGKDILQDWAGVKSTGLQLTP